MTNKFRRTYIRSKKDLVDPKNYFIDSTKLFGQQNFIDPTKYFR